MKQDFKKVNTHNRERMFHIGFSLLVAAIIGVLSFMATVYNPNQNCCVKNDMLEGKYRKILFSE